MSKKKKGKKAAPKLRVPPALDAGIYNETFLESLLDVDRTIPEDLCLDGKNGVVVGCDYKARKAIRLIGMQQGAEGHIAIIGPSGTGKSSRIACPTLFNWRGAIVATDIKGELSACYAELLRQGSVTRPYILFDPTRPATISHDPFWWLLHDSEQNLISNIKEIVEAIIPKVENDSQPFWYRSERGFLEAALLYYFLLGLSFSEAIDAIMEKSASDLYKELAEDEDLRIKAPLKALHNVKPETLACIDLGLRNQLAIFAFDENIGHAFRGARENAETFDWDDIDKYNIFLSVPNIRLDEWSGPINLMYTQLLHYLQRRPEQHSIEGQQNIQTLILMDEAGQFQRLEMLTSAVSTLRSKNVNICLMLQSLAQLDKIYGEYDRRIILDNCRYKVILGADDADTQKYVSELIGTEIIPQRSRSKHFDEEMNCTGYTVQTSEIREYQVQPHELSTMDDVLFLSPHGFFRPEKICWNGNLPNATQEVAAAMSGKRNEGAKPITVEERTANAARKAEAAKRQAQAKQRQKQEAQKKKDQRRKFLIGELVLNSELISQFFPKIQDFAPGSKPENAESLAPLAKFLSALADEPELVQQLMVQGQRKSDSQDTDWNLQQAECVNEQAIDSMSRGVDNYGNVLL